MIVVDTNILAYLYLPTDQTPAVEALYTADSHWVAPGLWRSEFRSILSLYIRKKLIPLEDAMAIQRAAEQLMQGKEYTIDSDSTLRVAAESGCSAYDCEFVTLALALRVRLLTYDKQLLKRFPDIAISPADYLL